MRSSKIIYKGLQNCEPHITKPSSLLTSRGVTTLIWSKNAEHYATLAGSKVVIHSAQTDKQASPQIRCQLCSTIQDTVDIGDL